MVRTMLSNGMSVSQVAKCLSRSEGKNHEKDFLVVFMTTFFLATLSGKRRFENYSVNI